MHTHSAIGLQFNLHQSYFEWLIIYLLQINVQIQQYLAKNCTCKHISTIIIQFITKMSITQCYSNEYSLDIIQYLIGTISCYMYFIYALKKNV